MRGVVMSKQVQTEFDWLLRETPAVLPAADPGDTLHHGTLPGMGQDTANRQSRPSSHDNDANAQPFCRFQSLFRRQSAEGISATTSMDRFGRRRRRCEPQRRTTLSGSSISLRASLNLRDFWRTRSAVTAHGFTMKGPAPQRISGGHRDVRGRFWRASRQATRRLRTQPASNVTRSGSIAGVLYLGTVSTAARSRATAVVTPQALISEGECEIPIVRLRQGSDGFGTFSLDFRGDVGLETDVAFSVGNLGQRDNKIVRNKTWTAKLQPFNISIPVPWWARKTMGPVSQGMKTDAMDGLYAANDSDA